MVKLSESITVPKETLLCFTSFDILPVSLYFRFCAFDGLPDSNELPPCLSVDCLIKEVGLIESRFLALALSSFLRVLSTSQAAV